MTCTWTLAGHLLSGAYDADLRRWRWGGDGWGWPWQAVARA
jgi:hypothetical protein